MSYCNVHHIMLSPADAGICPLCNSNDNVKDSTLSTSAQSSPARVSVVAKDDSVLVPNVILNFIDDAWHVTPDEVKNRDDCDNIKRAIERLARYRDALAATPQSGEGGAATQSMTKDKP